jgi:hypothetical protein
MEKQYEQIGNAVPPKLATFIGDPIVKYYNQKYKEKEIQWLLNKVNNNPDNEFYKGLLSWIKAGKELTEKQRKYIFL